MNENIDPKDYVKLFNMEESMFECYPEVLERQKLEAEGLFNVEILYILGQQYIKREDLEKYNFSNGKISGIIQLTRKACDDFLKFSGRISGKEAEDLTEADLMRIFDEFVVVFGRFMRLIDVTVYASYHFEKKVLEDFRAFHLSDKEIDSLLLPMRRSFHKRRYIDLLELENNVKRKEWFIRAWSWSMMELFHYRKMDETFISCQLECVKNRTAELQRIKLEETIQKKSVERIYPSLNEKLKENADLIQQLLTLRDFRIESILRGAYNLHPCFEKLAKALGISYEKMIYLTPIEIKAKHVPDDLSERMRGFCNIGGRIITGQKAQDLFDLFNNKQEKDHVKGIGVSTGTVKGTAKIVLSKNELFKIKKDDIIVCDITNPDYMHVLNRVKAIVANIGGFTSHSAIVAREFGIPCVVGSGDATNIFKDGDLIEVDANKGIVRKIK